jgi:aminoglycoside 3-N-acetyltransferase
MLTKEKVFEIFKNINLKSDDVVMIHSSLHNIGKIENDAEGLITYLKEYFKDGLILLPCHTWSFMKQDGDILNLEEQNSCVGILPNIALRSGFIRSHHPTHSIVAYGKKAEEYILLDDNVKTPVSPNGCFGSLYKYNAKILFLGCPLTKNTFIHSIEEEFNVNDRFTSHIYHFYSKSKDALYEYYMPKHYSSLNPHISENYIKLEKPMIEKSIAKYFLFGDANSIIVDSKKCYEYVSSLLKDNIHIFDDINPIIY